MKPTRLFALLVLLACWSLSAHAQDTCKIFSIPNPHGLDMTISSVSIVDTTNFTVSSVKTLPFLLGATESFDVEVCIKARDGKRHGTQVRYQTTHGQASYSVAMDAPSTASVGSGAGRQGGMSLTIAPNPATDAVTLHLDRADRSATARIYDSRGSLVDAITWEAGSTACRIDTRSMSAGIYLIVVTSEGSASLHRSLCITH